MTEMDERQSLSNKNYLSEEGISLAEQIITETDSCAQPFFIFFFLLFTSLHCVPGSHMAVNYFQVYCCYITVISRSHKIPYYGDGLLFITNIGRGDNYEV